jgi:hypothetical protein
MSNAAVFDQQFYLTNNADVVVAISQGQFANALDHFNQFGGKELRDPNGTFDMDYYAINNVDVLNAVSSGALANVFVHYQEHGESENRAPVSTFAAFDATAYLAANTDVADAVTAGTFTSALDHFIQFGQNESRAGAPAVNTVSATTTSLTDSTVTGTFDNFTGGAGNDAFVANANNLLLTGDTVDGGAGTDSISSRHTVTTGATISASLNNIENHTLRVDHDGGAADVFTYDMADMSGVSTLKLDRLNNTGTTADAVVTISGTGFAQTVTTEISGGDADADNNGIDITLTYQGAAGTGDSASMIWDGAGANVVTVAGMETINIAAETNETSTSATGASNINSLQVANASTINITGTGAVTIGQAAQGLAGVALNAAATVTVNASANTGGVSFTSEANTLTFTGGSGDDEVFMVATSTAADTLDAGEGTDVLGLTADVTATVGAQFSNFEILDIIDLAGNTTFDMDDYSNSTGMTTIRASGEFAGDSLATVNDIADGGTLQLGGVEAITADEDFTINVKNAGTAGQNSNVFNIETRGNLAVDAGTLTIANVETINITSEGAAAGDSIAVLTAAAMQNLTVTGSSDLTISALTSSAAMNNLNTSGMTGDFVMGAAVSNVATLFTGGSGADTFNGGTADDVFNAGAGNNTLDGGTGDDTYNIADGGTDTILQNASDSTAYSAETITEAAVAVGETLTFGNGIDVVNGFTAGASGDIINGANAGAPTTLVGSNQTANTSATTYFASGAFVLSTGVFTIAADGSGADTLIIDGGEKANMNDSADGIVLVGVNSSDIVAANVI